MRRAWGIFRASAADTLTYAVLAAVLLVLPLVPLIALADASLRPVALLGAVLFVLVTAPGRRMAASCLTRAASSGRLQAVPALDMSGYGHKLIGSLKTTVLLLLWAAPGIALTYWAYLQYIGATDAVTIAMQISKLGGGDIVTGVEYALLIWVASWLPLCFGLCLHSGIRYAEALGGRAVLKGKRGGVMRTWLASLVIAVPFLAAVAAILLCVCLPTVKTVAKTFQMDLLAPMAHSALLWGAASLLLLLVPLAPLRHLMLACHVQGLAEKKEQA